jgi:hypothetical protein
MLTAGYTEVAAGSGRTARLPQIPEIPINRSPAVAADSLSNFTVTWARGTQSNLYLGAILAKRYDANALPLGAGADRVDGSLVNSSPAVAVDSQDSLVFAWNFFGLSFPLPGIGIALKKVDSGGELDFNQIRVDTSSLTTLALSPAIAVNSQDEIVVAWSYLAVGDSGAGELVGDNGVVFKVFSPEGDVAVPEVLVDTNNVSRQPPDLASFPGLDIDSPPLVSFPIAPAQTFSPPLDPVLYTAPAVATDSEDNIIVVWSGTGLFGLLGGEDGGEELPPPQEASLPFAGIFYSQYDSGGSLLVDRQLLGFGLSPTVAMADNDSFLVVWMTYSPLSLRWRILAKRLTTRGEIGGIASRVDSGTYLANASPSVAADPDGNFWVAWKGVGRLGSLLANTVLVRKLHNDGQTALTGEIVVRTGLSATSRPRLTASPNGNVIVTWADINVNNPLSSLSQVWAQRLSTAGTLIGGAVRVDN